MAAMEELKRRKAGHKGALTFLTKNLKEIMDSGDENLIEAKLDSVKEQVQKFKDITELMASQFSSDELYVEELERDVEYLQPFEVNIKRMQRLLKQDQKDAKDNNKDQDKETKGKKPGVKLPHLKLPTYEGDLNIKRMQRLLKQDQKDV